ncbi:MAG: HAMP domain-containing sensor histidine kinase [Phycisphaerae bacterium]|jgi:signal transduction histidine kinase
MQRRMLVCLGLLLALCAVGMVIAMFCLRESIGELSRVAESHRIQSMRTRLASTAVSLQSNLLTYFDGNGQGNQDLVLSRFEDAQNQCNGCHHEPMVQAELDALRSSFDAYKSTAADLGFTDVGRAGERPDDVVGNRAEELASKLAQRATDLAERAGAHLVLQGADAASSIRHAWVILFATLIGAVGIGGLVALHLERRLSRPIAALLDGIEQARSGNVPRPLPVDADREFKVLAKAFTDAYRSLDSAHANMIQTEKIAATGRLAAGVAHEIGNPLASISATVQVMKRQAPADGNGKQLDLIMGEINRISRIIRELLQFSRPSEQTVRECLDVCELLDRTTSLLGYDRRAKGVQLDCHIRHPCLVNGDADQLLVVFTNVILNAFDALDGRERDDAALTITGERDDDTAVIRFEDNGTGMTEDQRARAFEPFFTTKAPGVGTGLGLWTSYRIVEQHDGQIELTSSPGVGTTVTIRLPFCQRETGVFASAGDGI